MKLLEQLGQTVPDDVRDLAESTVGRATAAHAALAEVPEADERELVRELAARTNLPEAEVESVVAAISELAEE